ncbi:hypothetical protein BDW74DRAFT_42462 [Aspergillus multicolor]|uniref:uncharacterized protein n=1 Tax=Aspergillus multicolor TaxID=41759 RepID=UPI003CCD1C40
MAQQPQPPSTILQTLPSYLMALDFIRPTSNEEPVQNLWQIITTTYFPTIEHYRYGFKAPVLGNSNMPDIVIFQIIPDPNPANVLSSPERQILLVECKGPKEDTVAGWTNTINGQFDDDMSENLNASRKIFGAVAIGKKVKFFSYDFNAAPGTPKRVELHQGAIDLAAAGGFAQTVAQMDAIKLNGWQWAS